jgi:hypothetical protein
VTCREMDDAISSRSGDFRFEPLLAEHLIQCKHCRSLTRLLAHVDNEFRPSDSLSRRITAGILEDLQPIRPLPSFSVLLSACATISLSVVGVGTLLLGTSGWRAQTLEQRIAMFVTLGASTVLLAISMVRQMVPGSKRFFSPAVLLVAISGLLMTVIAATFRSQEESAFLTNGVICMKNGFMYSIPAAFLLWLVLRRGGVLDPNLIGGVAGALAGLTGLSALEVNCSNLNVFHILVWHGGVVAISSVGGILLGTITYAHGARSIR